MKRQLITLLVGVLSALALQAQKPADRRLSGLDTFVNKVLHDWHAPGVAIAVVEKNAVVYTGGFGFRNYERKIPVDANTLFAIGSCTKAFTASILGMLVKEGKVNLDHPVRDYLPELKFQNEYTNDHATLRDMMCHRTGLPRHDLSWYGSSASRSELLKRIQYLEPSAELRERWQYNNFMFMAQGMVIEKLTGKSWEQNMKDRILVPLGMSHTDLSVSDMEKSPDHSLAYAIVHDSIIRAIPYRNIDAIGPAGSVNSCANDMANWLITWINSGSFKGHEIFPKSFRNDAIQVQMATGGGIPGPENSDIYGSGYGLAWGISSYRGHYRVEHGGGIDGFITSTSFFPSDSIGIFVVSCTSGPTASIRNFIADRMLKLPYRNWNKFLLDQNAKAKKAAAAQARTDSVGRKFGTHPSHPLAAYAGTYGNPGYGEMTIRLQGDSLMGHFNAFDLRLEHFHYDQFEAHIVDSNADNDNSLRISFMTDKMGDIDKFTVPLQAGVKDIEFTRISPKPDLSLSDLKEYSGEYTLSGVILRVTLSGNSLKLTVPGQPEYELVPSKTDEFKLKGLEGYSIRFERNPNHQVVALYSIQPNGTFKAVRK